MLRRFFGILLIIMILAPVSLLADESPMEAVKKHLDMVLEVLRDPTLAGEAGKATKIEKITAISESLFDFTELSRRSLAQNWKRFTPEQQKEFVSLYKKLLKKTYSDRIVSYNNENIVFKKEIPLTEKTVEVQTTIVTAKGDVSSDYRLIQDNGQWRVYDVVIEGVSLINNYRDQFRDILSNNPPDQLLEMLRKKVE